MMLIEFKDAAYSKAFELLDEAKEHSKNTKIVLCELEDALYECYESSGENEHDDNREYDSLGDSSEMNYRRGRRSAMRYHDEDDERLNRRMNSRRDTRMRRNMMSRYY